MEIEKKDALQQLLVNYDERELLALLSSHGLADMYEVKQKDWSKKKKILNVLMAAERRGLVEALVRSVGGVEQSSSSAGVVDLKPTNIPHRSPDEHLQPASRGTGSVTKDRLDRSRVTSLGHPGPEPTSSRSRQVHVIYGRDKQAANALRTFLRALDLHPLQWEELVASTGKGSPFVGEVIAKAFEYAQAIVVLITPDDQVRLHANLRYGDDPESEAELHGQPRPEVLLQAGMALGINPDRTILVEAGNLRPISILEGRDPVRLNGQMDSLVGLANRLYSGNCNVNFAGVDWEVAKSFPDLDAYRR